MRLLLPYVAVAAALAAALPAAASAQTFRIVSDDPPLPSYVEPNAPGSIALPFSLSTAPERPALRGYEELLALWRRAGDAYGVPWTVLAAINKIESNFGQNMGPSSAGAVGWMQFLPSTWARWGMDADGDGLADPWDPEDAVYAAARYLAAAGAHDDLERAIFAYNHADWYVRDVLELAETFGDDPLAPGAGALLYEVSSAEGRLAGLRGTAAEARAELARIDRRVERLALDRLRLERRAGDPALSEAEFRRVEARLGRVEAAEEAAAARRAGLERRLLDVAATVEALEAELAGAVLAAPAPSAAPSSSAEGYVFPVGGGPDLVSVAHDHHDYPAADIAAPEGTPLYALADATVVESYPGGNGRCGIGLKLLTDTGAVFVYCHLSLLAPAVAPGADLAAGAFVGEVGSTGNSTGPHLHLAFDPPLAYPQDEPWFAAYAGVAFRWQDAPTPERPDRARPADPERVQPAPGPVFRVVRPRTIRFSRP